MSRAGYRRRILHRLYERPRTHYELRQTFRPDSRAGFSTHLDLLLQCGAIAYDPTTFTYSLTDLGAEMRIKRNKPPITAGPVVNLQAEKERLIVEFSGPWGIVDEIVGEDPVLFERAKIAREQGCPAPELTTIPLHRRADAIEAALEHWFSTTRFGPCGFCGSPQVRRGSVLTKAWNDPIEVPGFSELHGQKACGACVELLDGHTLNEAKEILGNVIAGTTGVVVWGEYRYAALVKFAYEIPGGYVGKPWAWLTAAPYAEFLRDRARQVVHPKRFVRTAPLQEPVLGLTTHVWDEVPQPVRKVFRTLADAVAHAEEEAALQQRREAAAQAKAHKYDMFNRHRAERIAREDQSDAALRDRARELGVL